MSSDAAKEDVDRSARAVGENGVENGVHKDTSVPENVRIGSKESAGVQDGHPVEEADVDALYADIRPGDPAQGKPSVPDEDPERKDLESNATERPHGSRCDTVLSWSAERCVQYCL